MCRRLLSSIVMRSRDVADVEFHLASQLVDAQRQLSSEH